MGATGRTPYRDRQPHQNPMECEKGSASKERQEGGSRLLSSERWWKDIEQSNRNPDKYVCSVNGEPYYFSNSMSILRIPLLTFHDHGLWSNGKGHPDQSPHFTRRLKSRAEMNFSKVTQLVGCKVGAGPSSDLWPSVLLASVSASS